MNPTTRKAITVITLVEFAALLGISVLLFHYTYVAQGGGPGNWATDFLEGLLKRQEDMTGLAAAFVLAIPGLFLPMATTPTGAVTKWGKVALALLLVTFVFATTANVWLVPGPDAPGHNLAPLADTSALRLSSYAMTYVASILGLSKLFTKPGPEKGEN
ncbi:MAG: hypothetical protein K0M64_14060 [Rhizobium sp.]|nr:hypothetical protein [Rhizobium sp.]